MFSFGQKVKTALAKTRAALTDRLAALFGKTVDASLVEAFEKILYEADLGSRCVADFADIVRRELRKTPPAEGKAILEALRRHALTLLPTPPAMPERGKPHVILIVGVNGSGKTTSLAKLAALYKRQGKRVLIGAADTFRSAAIEQLSLWAERIGADFVAGAPGSDGAAVAFNAVAAAVARGIDIALIDTAGRLQTKSHLMQELEKMSRSCMKALPGAPHETLLILDATTGQNALDQARLFEKSTPLSGIILTKLDSSAKGGIILSIAKELAIPVRWIGIGEEEGDLAPFNAEEYVEALLGK